MSEKIKNIEFLRIVGCLAVIGYHLFKHFDYGYSAFKQYFDMTRFGCMAVDLFFVISGLFFALNLDLTKSLWQFLKKKLIRLYPVMVFMLIMGVIGYALGFYELNIYESILTFFVLNGTGLVKRIGSIQTGGNTFWYVSSMLWVMSFYFYLLKNFEIKIVNIIIALVSYGAYVMLIGHNDWEQSTYLGLMFNSGMCRALGGIGIGYFIAQWYNSNKDDFKAQTLNICQRIAISVLEIVVLGFVIYNLMFLTMSFNNPFVFMPFFALVVMLFLYNKGFISQILNQDIFIFLAKYTYSIYMVHYFVIFNLKHQLWLPHKYFTIIHPTLSILATYIVIILCGVFVYYLVEKPAGKFLK